MPLTELQLKALKPREKPFKVFDGRGLYIEVFPNGKCYWRMKYRFAGKEKRIAFGPYPLIKLSEARRKCDDARRQLIEAIDPSEQRKARKLVAVVSTEQTFEAVGREWFEMKSKRWAKSHADKIIGRLELHVFPWIGKKDIRTITAPEYLSVMRRIEASGANETAHRALQACGRIARYAIATGRATHDVPRDLRGALADVEERHYPTITDPREVAGMMRAIEGYEGTFIVRTAFRLAPLVWVRPSELRKAKWPEFDLDRAEWRIEKGRMKKRRVHIVPLSRQAIALLRDIQPQTGHLDWVFPGERDRKRPMSENAINAALRRIGYPQGVFTAHSFRSVASTLLHERGWNSDAIERQLSHVEEKKSKKAYNYAEHLPMRREMMQAWANYVDELRTGRAMPPSAGAAPTTAISALPAPTHSAPARTQ